MSAQLTERGTEAGLISREDFRSLFRHHPGAVCIITASGPSGHAGFTATSVVSVSAEPPVLAFSVARTSSAWSAVSEAERLTVHFLGHEHSDLAVRFATPNIDRFDGIDWSHSAEHGALLGGISTWATGSITSTTMLDASALVCVAISDSSVEAEHDALMYRDRAYSHIEPPSSLL